MAMPARAQAAFDVSEEIPLFTQKVRGAGYVDDDALRAIDRREGRVPRGPEGEGVKSLGIGGGIGISGMELGDERASVREGHAGRQAFAARASTAATRLTPWVAATRTSGGRQAHGTAASGPSAIGDTHRNRGPPPAFSAAAPLAFWNALLMAAITPRLLLWIVALLASAVLAGAHAQAPDGAVLAYHGRPDRSGNFIVPRLTWAMARSVHPDWHFQAPVSGHVYAQPLYWKRAGATSGVVLVATANDTVEALDGDTGQRVWERSLGKPAPLASLPCGNIDPLGITGTPVIDPTTEAVYLDAVVDGSSGPRHLLFGLSLKDGAVLAGWPIDVGEALKTIGQTFDPRVQNERGALTIVNGTLYVPFGGHFGDCGKYHGWVVGVSLENPRSVTAWKTRGTGGGIWAPGGISSDGRSLYVATGNNIDARSWSDGEAVFRLAPDLARTEGKRDFFASGDWRTLDQEDADLGGTNPLPIDLRTGNVSQALILALGKDRRAYLIDRNDLGGIGGSLAAETVSVRPIRTAPAMFPGSDGVLVAFQGEGAHCPSGRERGRGLTVLHIAAGSPPRISTAWCGAVEGRGSPIVTTTDGRANPIVWMLGAEGDNQLHAFRGDTGEPLITRDGPTGTMTGLRHFQTLIATDDRLYVAADGRVYAFAY